MKHSEEIAVSKLRKPLLTLVKPYLSDDDPVLLCCQTVNQPLFANGFGHAFVITQTHLISASILANGKTAVQPLDLATVVNVSEFANQDG